MRKYAFWPTRPPSNRWSLFSHMMSVRMTVRQKNKKPLQCQRRGPENKTTDTMHKNNDHLLAGAWWVTLKMRKYAFLSSWAKFYYAVYLCIHEPVKCMQRHIFCLLNVVYLLIHSADPSVTPVVIIAFTHIVRPSVANFQNIAKQNKCRVKIMNATGGTMGLAEWIIDDTSLVNFLSISLHRWPENHPYLAVS